eukprot:SAG22_NODE_114_length_19318_cov_13.809980_12_plen_106_part_00
MQIVHSFVKRKSKLSGRAAIAAGLGRGWRLGSLMARARRRAAAARDIYILQYGDACRIAGPRYTCSLYMVMHAGLPAREPPSPARRGCMIDERALRARAARDVHT